MQDSKVPMRYHVIMIPEAVCGYSVSVAAMPCFFSEVDTFDEAMANIELAMEGWLEVEFKQGRSALEENRQVLLQGIGAALETLEEMREADELPPDQFEELRLTTVEIRQLIVA